MPNTPALVGEGATGLFANKLVSDHQRTLAQSIMGSVGLISWMKNEKDMDTVTALSGSGPAYFSADGGNARGCSRTRFEEGSRRESNLSDRHRCI